MKPSLSILLAILCLAGCNPSTAMKVTAPPQDETTASGYINFLRQKNFAPIEQHLDASLQTPNIHQELVGMADLIPSGAPLSVKLIGYKTEHHGTFSDTGTISKTKLVYEYQFPGQWLVINVTMQKARGAESIIGFQVIPIPDSLENLNRFTFDGKGPLHYTVFALAILIPLYVLYALIACLRTKMLKWKWLWIIFILFGFMKFAMDWTTGQWEVGVLNLQFLGAGVAAVPYGAWIFFVSVPLGAIIFLHRRRKLEGESVE